MPNISLKKALKEKKNLLASMEQEKIKMLNNNSYEVGNTPAYDSKICLNSYVETRDKLINLKVAIHLANAPVYKEIFEMSELKTQITALKGMNVQEGKVRSHYGNQEPPIHAVSIGTVERDNLITTLGLRIEELQEILDEHNSKVKINY